jgi:hypothetical protein
VLPDREASIPLGMIDVKYKAPSGFEVEGFYQFEQRAYNLPACGTFFSGNDIGMDPGCKGSVLNTYLDISAYNMLDASVWYNTAYNVANHNVVPRTPDIHQDEHSQGGLALRYRVKPLKLDTSLYFLNLESRTPVLYSNKGTSAAAMDWQTENNTPDAGLMALLTSEGTVGEYGIYAHLLTALKALRYGFIYPGNIHTLGFNAATTLRGWRTAGEIEYTPNQPAGQNPGDMFNAMLVDVGPEKAEIDALPWGAYFKNYASFHTIKVDLNTMHVFPDVLKSKTFVVVAEAQDQGITNLPSLGQVRYNRDYQYGAAPFTLGDSNISAQIPACLAGKSVNGHLGGNYSDCYDKGYVTSNAFGYRLMLVLNYSARHNFTFSPSLVWKHDLKGYSSDWQIMERRARLAPAFNWGWKQRYFGGAGFTTKVFQSTYDTQKDRNYFQLFSGVNF